MQSEAKRDDPGPIQARTTFSCLVGADFGVALGLFAVLLAVYGIGFQERLTGDGGFLANRHALGVGRDYPHALYLPLCDLIRALLPVADPIAAPKVLSVLGGAAGGALTWLLCRALGAGRTAALFATGLLALSPVAWFFATTIEVHAPHYGAVAAVAALTLLGPWQRPGLAFALVVVAYPLVFLTHRSGAVLGLGWIFLIRLAAERHQHPLAWRTTLCVHGPVLLGVTLLGLALANLVQSGEFVLQTEAQRAFIDSFHGPPGASRIVRDGLIAPLALLLPVAILGLRPVLRERELALTLALAFLPVWAFFLWWGVPERGGYFLGTAPFLAVFAARAVPHGLDPRGAYFRFLVILGAVVLAIQAERGWRTVTEYDRGFRVEERVPQVRAALPEGGYLVSFHTSTPRIEVYLDDVFEFPTETWFSDQVGDPAGPEEFTKLAVEVLRGALRRTPVAVDLSAQRIEDDPVVVFRRPWVDRLAEALEVEFETTLHDHESWPVLRLRSRDQ